MYCVWAPAHRVVRVWVRRLAGAQDILPLVEQRDGYFAGRDRNGGAGDRYLFLLGDQPGLPDPASRFQPEGVHGWSECVSSDTFTWRCESWRRPGWHGQSIYELHVGTFTEEGTYRAAIERLGHIASLGVETIELMPIADFPGDRNWGYDGVALYAPARCYGRPDDLRALIDAAHDRGLAVILDVVYNHLGPDGNYLAQFAEAYFHVDRDTPWGQGFNLDGPGSRPVRDFILGNVTYWLDEFRFDGLRLDATHMIHDPSPRHLLTEIAELAHERGAFLVAEDERNTVELLWRKDGGGFHLDAVWADDFHHQLRVALTGEREAYFKNYGGSTEEIVLTLAQGWFYTGQPYASWDGRKRGEDGGHLTPSHFVICIQNHDQVGNRAQGERLEHLIAPPAYRAAAALLCLTPYPPLLFMGQEWAASSPFHFFTDHRGELGEAISAGRLKEFASVGLNREVAPNEIPDPQALATFERSKLGWMELGQEPHVGVPEVYRQSLAQRAQWLHGKATERGRWRVAALGGAFAIRYLETNDAVERLVVVALKGEMRLSLSGDAWLRAPEGQAWGVELQTSPTCIDATGLPAFPMLTRTRWGEPDHVEHLYFREPATVLLAAHPKGNREANR